ncbi:MAG TPA: glycine--tRNA ligase [bacterium]|nr:glycine--tRNA ligase [bacterium]
MQKIISLCKRRGFIYQDSEIYGGLGSVWDYGPLGVELKNNVKKIWWRSVVYERDDMEGLDSAILMHPDIWKASGHVTSFKDLLVDCKECQKRFKQEEIKESKCPECGGRLSKPKYFNLMFKTYIGSVEDKKSQIYLRPETAQGIFVDFAQVVTSMRRKLPFGIAQIGKAFRNEITTGNFTFRCREFEMMEIEYFVRPETAEKWHKSWIKERLAWYKKFGIKSKNLRVREHIGKELAHYAKACFDIEYQFPFGWGELEGLANRTDYDLSRHSEVSGKDLSFFDEESKEKIIPYVIEPSAGVDRSFLAFLIDAYREEKVRGEKRVVLGLHKDLAPIKAAVFPLLRNRPQIVKLAKKIARELRGPYKVVYDDTASIGRLYRRQDEVGTLYCVTVDVNSLNDKKVTVRDRDSMLQDRVAISRLKKYLDKKLKYEMR